MTSLYLSLVKYLETSKQDRLDSKGGLVPNIPLLKVALSLRGFREDPGYLLGINPDNIEILRDDLQKEGIETTLRPYVQARNRWREQNK